MANLLGMEVDLPTIGKGATQQAQSNPMMIIWIALVVIFLIIGAIAIFLIYQKRIYNRKIIVFENTGAGWSITHRDSARIVKVGDGGEELLYLKKKKVYRTAYGKKMSKNTYWFAIGQDGYWYNVTLGDLDAKMGMLDIEPIDRDMRYMHVAVRKNITERYRKIGFMEKYGTILMSGIFIIILMIGCYILINKMSKTAETINAGVDASVKVTEASSRILGSLDNILNGGNDLKPSSDSVIDSGGGTFVPVST